MAAQSQTSAPVLKVLRDLSSIMPGQTQTSTVFLARLMRLVSTLAAETETSSPNLIVLRALATVIAAQTQTSRGYLLQLLRAAHDGHRCRQHHQQSLSWPCCGS